MLQVTYLRASGLWFGSLTSKNIEENPAGEYKLYRVDVVVKHTSVG